MNEFTTFLNELWQGLGQNKETLKNIGTVCEEAIKIIGSSSIVATLFAIGLIKKK